MESRGHMVFLKWVSPTEGFIIHLRLLQLSLEAKSINLKLFGEGTNSIVRPALVPSPVAFAGILPRNHYFAITLSAALRGLW